MTLSERLKLYRQNKGISQDQLAKTAGIALSTLTKIEAGTATQPTIDTVIKLADALCVPLDKLVGRKSPRS